LSLKTRQELQQAIAERYRSATRLEKQHILDEFTQVTGVHRKHAIRALQRTSPKEVQPTLRSRLYNEATRQAVILLWEAADRICGKRLKSILPTRLDALERHGHLALDTAVRQYLVVMSAATIDRLPSPFEKSPDKEGEERSSTQPCGKVLRCGPLLIGTVRRRAIRDGLRMTRKLESALWGVSILSGDETITRK
jgi:hypothetical protein